MLLSKKNKPTKNPPVLTIDNIPIERTNSHKYLGIVLTSNLTWSEHIHCICSKAKKLLGLLYRQFYKNCDPTTLLSLYVCLIRPHLEYAIQVWNPHLLKDINKIENVQKFALRLCVKQWSQDYESLLSICDLPTLATRRKYLGLCTMYKIINGHVFFPPQVFAPRVTPLRPAQQMLFCQPFARTNSFQHSFVPHACSLWNNMSLSLRSADSISTFKPHVIKWLYLTYH